MQSFSKEEYPLNSRQNFLPGLCLNYSYPTYGKRVMDANEEREKGKNASNSLTTLLKLFLSLSFFRHPGLAIFLLSRRFSSPHLSPFYVTFTTFNFRFLLWTKNEIADQLSISRAWTLKFKGNKRISNKGRMIWKDTYNPKNGSGMNGIFIDRYKNNNIERAFLWAFFLISQPFRLKRSLYLHVVRASGVSTPSLVYSTRKTTPVIFPVHWRLRRLPEAITVSRKCVTYDTPECKTLEMSIENAYIGRSSPNPPALDSIFCHRYWKKNWVTIALKDWKRLI